MKNTNFEYCAYHKPKNSINIKFRYKSIFDKKEIPLEYFNITNIDIFNEHKNYIYKLLKNNKFKFPIKITIYTEFLVYDKKYIVIRFDQQHTVDITHITNYDKYFKNNEVLYQDILNIIKEFKDYYDTQKIEILKLHLNKNLKINRQKNENEFNELLNKFDELDFKTKNSLNKRIYFNKKYDKEIFTELCDLLGYQMEKVTKTYEILSENDINTVSDEIQKDIEDNHEKISTDSKKKFLTYRKMDVNIFKYEALKKHKNPNRIKIDDKKLFTEIYGINKSLEYLTKTIDDKDRFSLKQEFGENYELLTKKGIYPYDYFDSKEKYNETKIPDHTNFKNKLNNDKNISNKEYKHAHNVFKTFKCKN